MEILLKILDALHVSSYVLPSLLIYFLCSRVDRMLSPAEKASFVDWMERKHDAEGNSRRSVVRFFELIYSEHPWSASGLLRSCVASLIVIALVLVHIRVWLVLDITLNRDFLEPYLVRVSGHLCAAIVSDYIALIIFDRCLKSSVGNSTFRFAAGMAFGLFCIALCNSLIVVSIYSYEVLIDGWTLPISTHLRIFGDKILLFYTMTLHYSNLFYWIYVGSLIALAWFMLPFAAILIAKIFYAMQHSMNLLSDHLSYAREHPVEMVGILAGIFALLVIISGHLLLWV